MYNPKEDWKIIGVYDGIGGYEYRFDYETLEVKEGSRARREIYSDSEKEAWAKLTPPRW